MSLYIFTPNVMSHITKHHELKIVHVALSILGDKGQGVWIGGGVPMSHVDFMKWPCPLSLIKKLLLLVSLSTYLSIYLSISTPISIYISIIYTYIDT